MNKIYLIAGKQELIDTVNLLKRPSEYESKQITLTFMKKYPKYYPYLSFIPPVLADIIFEYVNDTFKLTLLIENDNGINITINQSIRLNYDPIMISISFCLIRLVFKRLECISHINCSYSCVIKQFMKKYYNKQLDSLSYRDSHDNSCNPYCVSKKIIKKIDNLRHFKNEIIIFHLINKIVGL